MNTPAQWMRKTTAPFKNRLFRFANAYKHDAVHLFLLAPPFSGARTLQQLLATSPHVAHVNATGQPLPELTRELGLIGWNPRRRTDWNYIRHILHSHWSPFKSIHLSHAHAYWARAYQIEQAFPGCCFLVLMRNPYAQIAGLLQFRGEQDPATLARFWVQAARMQMKNLARLERVLYLSYEMLTGETDVAVARLLDFLPDLKYIRPNNGKTAVNGNQATQHDLLNLNPKRIQQLTKAHIAIIDGVLGRHRDVLRFFGYELLPRVDKSK